MVGASKVAWRPYTDKRAQRMVGAAKGGVAPPKPQNPKPRDFQNSIAGVRLSPCRVLTDFLGFWGFISLRFS